MVRVVKVVKVGVLGTSTSHFTNTTLRDIEKSTRSGRPVRSQR